MRSTKPDIVADLEAQRPVGWRIDVAVRIQLERDERRAILLLRRRAFVHRRQVIEPDRKLFEHGVAAPHDRRARAASALRQSARTSQLCGTRPVARNSGTGETNRRHHPSIEVVTEVNAFQASKATMTQSRQAVAQQARPQPHREHRGGSGDGFEGEIERGAVNRPGEVRRPEQGDQSEPRPDRIRHAADQAIRCPAAMRPRSASTIMCTSPLKSTLGSQPSSFFALPGSPIR